MWAFGRTDRAPRRRPSRYGRLTCTTASRLLLVVGQHAVDGVLDLLARLLDVTDGLVSLSFALQILVARHTADDILRLALGRVCRVLCLVFESHVGTSPL